MFYRRPAMKIEKSVVYKGIRKDLDKKYGKARAGRIWENANRKNAIFENDNQAVDKTTAQMIFPAVAIYQAIEEEAPGDALDITRAYGKKVGLSVKKIFERITALPGVPTLVWKNMDKLARKMSEGYEVENVHITDTYCNMDVTGCPLYDMAKQLGTPEAAQMVCCMDKEYMTGIRGLDYSRTKSVAEGDDCCDYRLKKSDTAGKKNNKIKKTSISYRLMENMCYTFNKLPGGGAKSLLMKGVDNLIGQEELPKWMYKKNINIRMFKKDGFKIFRLRSKGNERSIERAVLYIPGGGGMTRPTGLHYNAALKIAQETGADVYLCFYPLAPDYNVRDALNWLEKIYASLIKKYDAENIIFWGDSAGANLILSLTYRVEDKPGKLIAVSPVCGLFNGGKRKITKSMEQLDPVLTVEMNDMIVEKWSKGVPLDSPDISPECIDYIGFPYMYFFYGEHEIFYPHVVNYLDSLRKQGIRFEEEVKPMFHDWAICYFFPEGRAAIQKMCSIITDNT